jgi:hypothetical protein
VITPEDRRALEAEVSDLVARYGVVPVIDVVGALCADHARRIGTLFNRQSASDLVRGFLSGLREGLSRGKEGA